tara:strand:+ start:24499 stop:25296 length:798 start_codon:yes stop_codon:yes gene_type:complete
MKVGAGIFGIIFLFAMMNTCGNSRREKVSTDVITQEFAKGLDLKAVSDMAKSSKDAADLERKLNTQSSGINNIDLNDDGKVDYIKVTEYGSDDTRGFSLTTDLSASEVQEIATIEFVKNGNLSTMDTRGNSSLYGSGNHYRSSFGLTDALLLGYIFSSHSNYSSPHRWNSYPPHYGRGWSRMDDNTYAGNVRSRYPGRSFQSGDGAKPILASPNQQKQAARARVISNPTKSQQSFTKRTGKSVSSGGFGRSSSSSSGRSSFGGGK